MKPFDPNDPFDVVAERFRQEICDIAGSMFDDAAYRRLTPVQQLEAFLGGSLVAVVGVCFAHITEAGRDVMMEGIIGYLLQARDQAEAILEDAARQTRQ
jgi:hypothetical protein